MPSPQWVPQYVMPAAPIPPVDDSYSLAAAGHMGAAYKGDGQPPRGVSVMLPSPEPTAVPYNHMIPQVQIGCILSLNCGVLLHYGLGLINFFVVNCANGSDASINWIIYIAILLILSTNNSSSACGRV